MEAEFLLDSGADISIASFPEFQSKNDIMDNGKIVRGIGGGQVIGPKKNYQIRFSCDHSKIYNIQLSESKLPSKKNFIILGRDFLSQFGSTEFGWEESKIRLGESWIFLNISESLKINEDLDKSKRSQFQALARSRQHSFTHQQ